jgi:hypothetical protein
LGNGVKGLLEIGGLVVMGVRGTGLVFGGSPEHAILIIEKSQAG